MYLWRDCKFFQKNFNSHGRQTVAHFTLPFKLRCRRVIIACNRISDEKAFVSRLIPFLFVFRQLFLLFHLILVLFCSKQLGQRERTVFPSCVLMKFSIKYAEISSEWNIFVIRKQMMSQQLSGSVLLLLSFEIEQPHIRFPFSICDRFKRTSDSKVITAFIWCIPLFCGEHGPVAGRARRWSLSNYSDTDYYRIFKDNTGFNIYCQFQRIWRD